jgi:GTP-binding protein HflX
MSPAQLVELRPPAERAFLVAVDTGQEPGWSASESLDELAALADTAGAEVVGAEWQNRRHPDPNWYLGKGKAEELREARTQTGFTLLVADDELAQLEYQLPRLTRLWTHLSRTGGGIGTRGPGETQLETDRRVIRERIKRLRGRVETVRRQRETAARSRDRRLVPTVAIVGYTNAGKSTLLNALVGAEAARAEDRLFATLDPTSRAVKLGDGQSAIATDTVGFIHKLPHQLVDAFRATLEEVTRADVLLEVVDVSDRHAAEHRQTVQAVLDELGAGDKPRLVVWNKADLLDARVDGDGSGPILGDAVLVSAQTGFGLEALRTGLSARLAELWEEVDVAVPYTQGELLARVRERGTVDLRYRGRDVRVRGRITPSLAGELKAAAAEWRGAAPD